MAWLAEIRKTLCVSACALLFAEGACGATRPQYGGVLRVAVRAPAITLNPRRWKAGSADFATNQRLAELVFDRLVALDNYGRFQPQLATQWSHDGAAKRWQFTLRQGVRFSDGTLCGPFDVVAALQPMLPNGVQISAMANGVVIQSASAMGDLLEILSSGPLFIYRYDEKVGLVGTGSFVLETDSTKLQPPSEKNSSDGAAGPSERLRFRCNELSWSGRPFVDAVDVTLGVQPLRALLDLQLGKADLAELSEDTARRAQQSNVKVWASAPLTLYAVKFAAHAKSESERTLREALAWSLDCNAMARVLLQKQAEPAWSFLPQWMSGYAFLFDLMDDREAVDMKNHLERAKELRARLPASAVGAAQPLRVGLDANNELAKLIGERVVVNARAAGLMLQVTLRGSARPGGDGAAAKTESEAQLVAWRYGSLSPREDLETVAVAWRWKIPEGGVPADAEARYAWEKQMMDERDILPLVAVPDFVALDARVRNWAPSPWGEWRLADVWLDAQSKSAGGANP